MKLTHIKIKSDYHNSITTGYTSRGDTRYLEWFLYDFVGFVIHCEPKQTVKCEMIMFNDYKSAEEGIKFRIEQ